MRTNIIDSVSKRLKSLKSIKIAILYGSQAAGMARKGQDAYLCVVGNTKSAELKVRKLNPPNLNFLSFKSLPLYVQYCILKYGNIIVNKDDYFLTRLRISVVKQYLDEKYWLDKFMQRRPEAFQTDRLTSMCSRLIAQGSTR